MSEKLPVLKPLEVIRALEKLGFEKIRQKGSHAFFYHADGRHTTISIHPKDMKRSLLHKVLKDIRMNAEEFNHYLKT